MSNSFHNALLAYDNIVNNNDKLRESVRYFFAKYPEEAMASIAERDANNNPIVYLNGIVIEQRHISHMRALWNNGSLVEAIKYCRALRNPVFGLKEAKDFVEQYCS